MQGISSGPEANPVESAFKQLQAGSLWAEGPDDTETEIEQLRVPDGSIETRSFALLLTLLNVLNKSVNKIAALNLVADIKGESKQISYPHFRAALKKIVTLGGKSMVEVMGLHHEADVEMEHSADALEEDILHKRDRHIEQERLVLGSILSDLQVMTHQPLSEAGSASTYGMRGKGGLDAESGHKKEEGGNSLAKDEMSLLTDINEALTGMESTVENASGQFHTA